jgi:hypothetical protein
LFQAIAPARRQQTPARSRQQSKDLKERGRRIASANVAAFVAAAQDHFKGNPIAPVEEWSATPLG